MKSIDTAISQIETLQKVLKKNIAVQVCDIDSKSTIKANALSWFQNIRAQINLTDEQLKEVDERYKFLLEAAERKTTKTRYLSELKDIRLKLIALRSDNIIAITNQNLITSDKVPDFSTLIKDDRMKSILSSRWDECIKCVGFDAPLSALVMMGGMLEAILLAKINSFSDKSFEPPGKDT